MFLKQEEQVNPRQMVVDILQPGGSSREVKVLVDVWMILPMVFHDEVDEGKSVHTTYSLDLQNESEELGVSRELFRCVELLACVTELEFPSFFTPVFISDRITTEPNAKIVCEFSKAKQTVSDSAPNMQHQMKPYRLQFAYCFDGSGRSMICYVLI